MLSFLRNGLPWSQCPGIFTNAPCGSQVLVLRQGLLAGIVTPKDLLNRVVAKGLDAESTPLSEVMTPNPDTVPPSMAVLDALKEVRRSRQGDVLRSPGDRSVVRRAYPGT